MIETGIAKAGLDNSANLMEITEETRRALQLMREDMISEVLCVTFDVTLLRHCAHSADPQVHGAQDV